MPLDKESLIRLICEHCDFYKESEKDLECGAFKILKGLLEKKPEEVIRRAVWGMIPKNKLGRAVYKKLKVYRGTEHPHQAQNPQVHAF